MPTLIYKLGRVEAWEVPGEGFYVYGIYQSGDPRVVQGRAMALEIAGSR